MSVHAGSAPGTAVLTVLEQGREPRLTACQAESRLEYRQIDEYPADGFRAWEGPGRDGVRVFDVAASAGELRAGFEQHALNCPVAQTLVSARPAVLLVHGVLGFTLELPRIADMMGVPCVLVLTPPGRLPTTMDDATRQWLDDALGRCRYIVAADQTLRDAFAPHLPADKLVQAEQLPALLEEMLRAPRPTFRFDYSLYEFLARDHPLLSAMQRGDTRHFEAAERVLDVACGAGIFLDCLRREGISGLGVERDPVVAEYGRGIGLDITTVDALDYLRDTAQQFDGIYCSHFIEHLPVEAVEELLALLYRALLPGGCAVLVFPDPESIRSQLLGFWRDPEHVRFYHPQLVTTMAAARGFVLEWSSYHEQPHEVVPFTVSPPELSAPLSLPELPSAVGDDSKAGRGLWLNELWDKLGLLSRRRAREQEQRWQAWGEQVLHSMAREQERVAQLQGRTEQLWQVNSTWAWNDNATLRLRKPA